MRDTYIGFEAQKYLSNLSTYCTHAITLQTKLATHNVSAKQMELMLENASRSVRQFNRRLATKAYGNGATRKPNLYHPLIITAIEGTTNTYDNNRTLHAHIALGNVLTPKSKIKTEEQLRQTIKDEWLKTRDGINNIDIQLMHSNGWITYITKEMQNGNMECVDWQNCHIPYAALSL
jgi:beta-glucanase (GH16 family)